MQVFKFYIKNTSVHFQEYVFNDIEMYQNIKRDLLLSNKEKEEKLKNLKNKDAEHLSKLKPLFMMKYILIKNKFQKQI